MSTGCFGRRWMLPTSLRPRRPPKPPGKPAGRGMVEIRTQAYLRAIQWKAAPLASAAGKDRPEALHRWVRSRQRGRECLLYVIAILAPRRDLPGFECYASMALAVDPHSRAACNEPLKRIRNRIGQILSGTACISRSLDHTGAQRPSGAAGPLRPLRDRFSVL